MALTRRELLRAGLGAAGAAALAGCAVPTGSTGRDMTLWYWTGGLSANVLDGATKRFTEVDLKPVKIGGYVKSKLLTNLAGQAYIPDITGLKGQDIAAFFAHDDQFVDLRTLGAEKFAGQFLSWKWQQGFAPDGRMLGFPIDAAPTGLFYRADLFGKAGLPTTPADVAREMPTWDRYFQAGLKLQKASPEQHLVMNIPAVFRMALYQRADQFVDKSGKFIGDRPHVRRAWDIAIEAHRMGVSAGIPDSTDDATGAIANGLVPSQVAPSWSGADMKNQAPGTKGKWRVTAAPDGPGNYGGSFLGITKACRRPEIAFQIITWLQNPDNQVQGYIDEVLFPSSPASFTKPAMRTPDDFFGGQVTVDVFATSARGVPPIYLSPYEDVLFQAYFDELSNVDSQGKNPDTAWRDTQDKVHRIVEHWGLS